MDYQSALTKPTVLGKEVLVEIEKGDSLDRICEKLLAQKLSINPFWFKAIAFLGKTYKKIKTGEYELSLGLTIPEILDLFVQGKTKQYSITFPEGWNFNEIVQELEKNPNLDHQLIKTDFPATMARLGMESKQAVNTPSPQPLQSSAIVPDIALDRSSLHDSTSAIVPDIALPPASMQSSSIPGVVPPDLTSMEGGNAARMPGAVAAVRSLEGMFFPDTYFFEKHTTDIALLKRSYDKMQSILQQEWLNKADGLPFKTPYEALILASIVEKETGDKTERPLIAGVFVRRLQNDMLLQTDPTVIYGMGDKFQGGIGYNDLKTATPYNTYMIKGLPPTPIAMPGRDAIVATLHPDNGNSLYFVSRGDGTHVFSATLKDHNLAVNKYQRKKSD
jgi:UPF0755 protein